MIGFLIAYAIAHMIFSHKNCRASPQASKSALRKFANRMDTIDGSFINALNNVLVLIALCNVKVIFRFLNSVQEVRINCGYP